MDILLIKQIELKYLSKIKKLLYMLAVDGPKAPNVSQLANDRLVFIHVQCLIIAVVLDAKGAHAAVQRVHDIHGRCV